LTVRNVLGNTTVNLLANKPWGREGEGHPSQAPTRHVMKGGVRIPRKEGHVLPKSKDAGDASRNAKRAEGEPPKFSDTHAAVGEAPQTVNNKTKKKFPHN